MIGVAAGLGGLILGGIIAAQPTYGYEQQPAYPTYQQPAYGVAPAAYRQRRRGRVVHNYHYRQRPYLQAPVQQQYYYPQPQQYYYQHPYYHQHQEYETPHQEWHEHHGDDDD